MNTAPILRVENLTVAFDTGQGPLTAVDDVSFTVQSGETLGIVGESGCGKSVTAFSIMRLLPRPAGRIAGGRIRFGDRDVTALRADRLPALRGRRMAMIFQEPMTALNPVHRLGRQVTEAFRLHYPEMKPAEARAAAEGMLDKVGIPDPRRRMGEYPHQISGGMRQRVMIAMALACRPELLIADEPTTALDVTIQAQILELMRRLQQETGMGILFITHDMGVIAEMCRRVLVMYAGTVAETAPVGPLFHQPLHPYTRGLLTSIPRLELAPKSRLAVIEGMVPALADMPEGCRFRNRCPQAMDRCARGVPPPVEAEPGHWVSCFLYD